MPLFRPAETPFTGVEQLWDLPRLYADLSTIKQRDLTSTEQICLQGLLWGAAPSRIAEVLHRQPQGLRVDLSRGLYRYITSLTQQYVKHWRDVSVLLERSGYRFGQTLDEERSYPLEPNKKLNNEPDISLDRLPKLGASAADRDADHYENRQFELTLVQNLPIQDFTTLIGRQQEFHQLLEMLS